MCSMSKNSLHKYVCSIKEVTSKEVVAPEVHPNTFQETLMDSLPTESFPVEEHQTEIDDRRRVERTQWILNSPDPPNLFKELISSVKETICSSSSSSPKQPQSRRAVCFLRGLFPILSWARNYKASKFKADLMAGLTLASLSIPQVNIRKTLHKCLKYLHLQFREIILQSTS